MRLLRSARLFLFALLVAVIPASAHAGIFISVGFAPPVLPIYVQPICPEPNLMWMPGYWAYGDDGYYWVPGAWVPAPYVGALWTPGYWGWNNGLYVFNDGYWGPHIGYYGGVNYGFGYMGMGFAGGEWRGGYFAYNTAIVHVNTTIIHNTYINETIVHNTTIVNEKNVAYSGGPGGIQHKPTAEEQVAMHETHLPPTKFQTQHVQTARLDKTSYAKVNGGHPTHLVAEKPLAEEKHAPPPAVAHTATPAHGAPAPHPTPTAHTATPARVGEPEHAPTAAPARATEPEHVAPHPASAARPAPVERPAPPERPAPAARPAPAERPAPAAHPAPKPEPKPKGLR
jgi:hypothetical protein